MKKKVLITGITGQLGSYLAEKFLDMNYETYGIIRRSSSPTPTLRIDHIFDKLHLVYSDITDGISLDGVFHDIKPDYIINAAAQSHVGISFSIPEYTAQTDAVGVLRVLESMRKHCPDSKLIQLSTSELFGRVLEIPQTEKTPPNPVSPYSAAKLYAYNLTKIYREAYSMFCSNAICFNMESPRRGHNFITKKITLGLCDFIKNEKILKLGNLNSLRDWGFCPEYCDGLILMLNQKNSDDFVFSTGENHTIREFVEEAAKYVNMDIIWEGIDIEEKGIDSKTGKIVIEVDEKYFRPLEVDTLLGNSQKAFQILGWEAKTKFKELVKIMMEYDLKNN